jgi:tetratricopeptide (TPR) repeat protein
MSDRKPVVFISYSHKDEPEADPEGDIHWLRDIQSYIAPAVNGTYELWTDEDITGGADWERRIKEKLAACDICILLVSRHSLASKYVIEVEIDTILKRQQQGHAVQLYPIVLSPFPQAAAPASLLALNLRPRLDRPLSGYSRHNRGTAISKIADEIVGILRSKTVATTTARTEPPKLPAFVHTTGLPETAYERLVGREAELRRLDRAWNDRQTNIISLIAEGGAGKSALVNEWLKKIQADNCRGAEIVLGWSFYSQGTKERATSAEQFLNWAIERLGIKTEGTSASAKGETIAEEMMKRRVLLLLDGCEPLQHGLDKQQGELKDQGLRALLRRFAAMPPTEAHGVILLTSRLPIKDIARWKESAAPVVSIEKLSDEAGAALLRDNGVWGTDKELRAAARDFGGHALALGLLASFLKETQLGDVRRRDHIRAFFADHDSPRHDHAKRVMESYDREWLTSQPLLHAIMDLVGLFDRPATGDCLKALRAEPVIEGLTDQIVKFSNSEWQRAVARLRDARLLAPVDPSASEALDAHPLVREWFGGRLRQLNEVAWKEAHGRLYEHLRDATKEGQEPTLEDIAPLYQAIAHGCRAERYQEVLRDVYVNRICRRTPAGKLEFYARRKLGSNGSNLAAVSWFFGKPYETPVAGLTPIERSWVLSEAAIALRAQGRLAEALSAERAGVQMDEEAEDWTNAALSTYNLSEAELLLGEIGAAVLTAKKCIAHAKRSQDQFLIMCAIATYAVALHAAGKPDESARLFADAEQEQQKLEPKNKFLYSLRGYHYCDLLLTNGELLPVRKRATATIAIARQGNIPLQIALAALTLGRAHFGLALQKVALLLGEPTSSHASTASARLNDAIDSLRASGQSDDLPRGLLVRAALRRTIGDWVGSARDLDEVEEIAEPGPMRLYLCDTVLERARLAFAKIEAFAPLNELIDESLLKPVVPDTGEVTRLKQETEKQLAIGAEYIKTCGYHRRDGELAALQAVLRGERKFADLPPRV